MAAAWIGDFLVRHELPDSYRRTLDRVVEPLAARLARDAAEHTAPRVVGLCGPQASGKSTLTAALGFALQDKGLACVGFSIDDLYLPRPARLVLAETAHPLLATRGPPGTHDVALGDRLLNALATPGRHALPRFDKATDDRAAQQDWPVVEGPAQIILFEGWCVGARPQPEGDLTAPVNRREAEEDPDGVWRRYVNKALAGPYQALFGRIDHLILLAPPSFDVVVGWRQEQEAKLRERLKRLGGDSARTQSDADIARFVQLYERLTRHILAEMPDRADSLIRLGPNREPERVR